MYGISLRPDFQSFTSWKEESVATIKSNLEAKFELDDGTKPKVTVNGKADTSLWIVEYPRFEDVCQLFNPRTGLPLYRHPYKFRIWYKTAMYDIELKPKTMKTQDFHALARNVNDLNVVFFSRVISDHSWIFSLRNMDDFKILGDMLKQRDLVQSINMIPSGFYKSNIQHHWDDITFSSVWPNLPKTTKATGTIMTNESGPPQTQAASPQQSLAYHQAVANNPPMTFPLINQDVNLSQGLPMITPDLLMSMQMGSFNLPPEMQDLNIPLNGVTLPALHDSTANSAAGIISSRDFLLFPKPACDINESLARINQMILGIQVETDSIRRSLGHRA